MKVCAIIVVFDHKKGSLDEILNRLIHISVNRIIIVNNGSEELNYSSESIIDVVNANKNLGAVGGFTLGMKKALKTDCDNFWLLDEDNLPEENALSVLSKDWLNLTQDTPENKLMMLSFRPQLFKYLHLSRKGDSLNIGPLKNSYLGFHYRQLFHFIYRRLTRSGANVNSNDHGLVKMNMGYFGGLFLHRTVVEEDFLPDERFIIYWGDLHFTKRFKMAGGNIYMSCKSVVHDIEDEGELKQKAHFLHHPILDLMPAFKAFDYVKGLLLFEGEVQKSVIPYTINKMIMLSLIGIMALFRGKWSRLKLLTKASSAIAKESK